MDSSFRAIFVSSAFSTFFSYDILYVQLQQPVKIKYTEKILEERIPVIPGLVVFYLVFHSAKRCNVHK